jgi:hypothetical protein
VLMAIVRKRLKLDASLYTLMQVFSVTVFEKVSIEPRRHLEWVVTATSCLNSPGYPLRRVSWFG